MMLAYITQTHTHTHTHTHTQTHTRTHTRRKSASSAKAGIERKACTYTIKIHATVHTHAL